jgi:hydroxypyruvate isomerase
MKKGFTLRYAPHFGMFRESAGEKLTDQLKFAAEAGFTAFEDNQMPRRPVATQAEIAAEMDRLGMEMGVFVGASSFQEVTFAGDDASARESVLADISNAVEVAKRVNVKWCTVVPGLYDLKLDWDYQTVNVIDLLQRCCEICEKSGLIMVLEPLNRLTNHPRVFLAKASQAYLICKAVDHPCCKILYDIYHQQITEGNLIPNIERSYSEIAYFQVGDNPGRKEPTTGEINYGKVFQFIHEKGYRGLVGMEHGNSQPGRDGEQAVIDAYRQCDPS